MIKKYAVTGMGLIDSLGHDLDKNFNRSLDPVRLVPKLNFQHSGLKVSRGFSVDLDNLSIPGLSSNESRNFTSYSKMALYAAHQAISQSNIPPGDNVSVLISSANGGFDSLDKTAEHVKESKRINLLLTLSSAHDFAAGLISTKYGFTGHVTSLQTSCATGLYTIDYAQKILDSSDADYVIVGGSDNMVNLFDLYHFQGLGALSTRDSDNCSQPFSKNRDGFVMGSGAGVIVLETLEHAQQRGAHIYGILYGVGVVSDGNYLPNPDEKCHGSFGSINKAIIKSGLKNTDIGFVDAHATSTPLGDKIEFQLISQFFPKTPITARKGHIGHTISAAGIIETIYTIYSLNSGIILPVANFDETDFDNDSVIVKEPTKTDAQYAMKNCYGFGGKCASMVIEKGINK